jgi:hypothetical protein
MIVLLTLNERLSRIGGDIVGGLNVWPQRLDGVDPSALQIADIRFFAAPSTAFATAVLGLSSCDPIWVQFIPDRTPGENWDPPLYVTLRFAISTKGIDECG